MLLRSRAGSKAEEQPSVATQPEATAVHCAYAFACLEAHLQGDPAPEPTFEDAHCALFVTWNKRSSSGGGGGAHHLRGCIGTLEPRRMHTALKDYALTSALRDSRFSPIAAVELPRLSVAVSLLHSFEPAAGGHLDWEVGRHGLIIEFTDAQLRCRRSATFLPDVCPEQGWSKAHCIDALIKKTGYSGAITDALRASLKVTRYQSTKAALSHSEYLRLRQQQQQQQQQQQRRLEQPGGGGVAAAAEHELEPLAPAGVVLA